MLIKALRDVATDKEKRNINDVQWGRLATKPPPGGKHSILTNTQRGLITGVWRLGCSLTTRQCLLAGENIWIKARDELGKPILSFIGTVIWSDHSFRSDGYRCEVRFRDELPA